MSSSSLPQQRNRPHDHRGLRPQGPLAVGFFGTVGVGLALLLYYIFDHTGPLPMWITAALFIALGLDPVVRFLQNRKVPRGAGVLIVFLGVAGVVALFVSLIVPVTVSQLTMFFQSLPRTLEEATQTPTFQKINSAIGVQDQLTQAINKLAKDATNPGGLIERAISAGQAIVNGLFGTLIVLVLTLYFLVSLPTMKSWFYSLVPSSRRKRVSELTEDITKSVGSYVLGQTTVAALNATFALIVMLIVGVPFPWLFFCVVALLAVIPLVGPPIALVVVSLVALTEGWGTAVGFAIPYMVYLQVEAYLISPRIMQRAVSVPGPVAVIAVIAGGSVLGVLGALIAIPTAAAVMHLLREVVIPRQDRR
ncbi:AI-2E family transporter [Falsarthrobacter nasiphocae]|uniref:PurR-regulated permease PerM n=1 Tax=Falsarthrobacter nasiphocae TaxID=189863 RepID=A0AAE3YGI2_9MICC|nr:AI-2E family transporter [Falsarthrobacter nasiphocae]MDR6892785.1 putative PurR-regulated permease PerM [Falsarthrobacter nasiphocae]